MPGTTTPEFVAELGIEMLPVPGGEFVMGTAPGAIAAPPAVAVCGSPEALGRCPSVLGAAAGAGARPSSLALRARECPEHAVELGTFSIGRHPVTRGQFAAFAADRTRGAGAERLRGLDGRDEAFLPACFISWDEAAAFCRWLSSRTGAAFRIPTEAEWEMAARGTDQRAYPWGDEPPTSWRCNFGGEVGTVTDVRCYPSGASPFGCFDMAGNVWEWCADWFDPGFYAQSPRRNPTGPVSGMSRVVRGGAYDSETSALRCAARFYDNPAGPTFFPCGFRVVLPG